MPVGVSIKVLVTGATGAIGPSVVHAFHQAGYNIRTFSRTPPKTGLFPENVDVRIGDVADPLAVKSAVQGVEAVVHLAALLHTVNPSISLRDTYERINVDGTATIVDAAIRANVDRLVFFSTIAVYGYATGEILTEDTPPQPETFYAQTKLAAERIVLNAKRLDGQPLGTVLRLGAVYGARIKGNYRRLLRSLAHRRFIPIGDGRNRRTLIYDKDVANAAVLAMCYPAAAGQIYNASDGQFHTLNKIITTMCDSLGRTPPHMSLPVRPARFGAGILEDAARLLGRQSPIGRATIDKYSEDIAVDSHRLQTELGFVPRVDLAAGWKETVQEMRQNGEL